MGNLETIKRNDYEIHLQQERKILYTTIDRIDEFLTT
jgi:hypothetical protein